MLAPDALERYLHEQIPLSRAMGARVAEISAAGVVITAPLAENHNHLGTAFGGSIAALATLCGYAALWDEMAGEAVHLVVRQSSTAYLRPIRKELRAVCKRPVAEEMARFRADFARKKKARILLSVTLEEDGQTAAAFSGTFVAVGGEVEK